jgi:regulator of sigma E protease
LGNTPCPNITYFNKTTETTMPSIPILIITLGFLILIHELGHFLAAKAVGIPIQEFGIGFPPKMLTLFRKWGTEFTLNWLPVGGFVRAQERPDDHNVPDEMLAAKPGPRIIFLLAGSTVNLVFAVIFLATSFYMLHSSLDYVMISSVDKDSPAEKAGIQAEDQILSINGYETLVVEEYQQIILDNAGKEVEVTLLRGDETVTVRLTPRVKGEYDPTREGATGVGLIEPQELTFGEAIVQSVVSFYYMTIGMFNQALEFIGFVGMNRILETTLSSSRPGSNTLGFVASLSFSLGILNLLPVPIFDGGKILFAFWELITRRRVPINLYYILNMASLAFVLLLMVYINVQDVVNPVIEAVTQTPVP